jgi:hypothetical protein
VVVLPSIDGDCIARSNKATDLGVMMAQPWFQAHHFGRCRSTGSTKTAPRAALFGAVDGGDHSGV